MISLYVYFSCVQCLCFISSPGGFRSVKAPQYDPSVKKQEKQQLMRCGGCDMLVT